ncbi:MAG: hypothetical protein R2827_04810 [Bdellovibrionales bacterium]
MDSKEANSEASLPRSQESGAVTPEEYLKMRSSTTSQVVPRVKAENWQPKHQVIAEKLQLTEEEKSSLASGDGLPLDRLAKSYHENRKKVEQWKEDPKNKEAILHAKQQVKEKQAKQLEKQKKQEDLQNKIDQWVQKFFGLLQVLVLLITVLTLYRWVFGRKSKKSESRDELRQKQEKLKKAWASIKAARAKKVSPREEVITTYLTLIDFLKNTPLCKEDWESNWGYMLTFSETIPSKESDILEFTRIYCDTFYGNHAVQESEIEQFRHHTKKLFQAIHARL